MDENILEKVKLNKLPKTAKMFVSMFLVVITCGYLMAILNINTSMGNLKETYVPGEKITYEFSGGLFTNIVNHYRGSVTDPAGYPGMDLPTMTATSHTHFIAMGMMMFCLGLVFLFTRTLPEWLKRFVLVDSFAAVIIAVAAFWFIKYVSGLGALLMMFSGMLLGFCVMFETAVPLYEMWLKKECACAPAVEEPAAAAAPAEPKAAAAALTAIEENSD